MKSTRALVLTSFLLTATIATADGPEQIEVDPATAGFRTVQSKQPFEPRGFNYDHDETGRLIEDYWTNEWPKVEQDFREMKALGANVVRIHLQFARFCPDPDIIDEASIERLGRLLALAQQLSLYLDLTGLGCYHKADVPAWYDALDEPARWKAQAVFWKAIAARCANSPAVFCYDLMNEPVVPGGPREPGDWLGPPFAGKHFVQFITLDPSGRKRPDVAHAWVQTMVEAIRSVDRSHLITVGLVDWSLDRPGLTSGFVPSKIAPSLDFLSIHLYPERGKIDDALETLSAFAAAGKPVVIEETFPLKCSGPEFASFLKRSREHGAKGWIGFYWGKTPDELRKANTIGEAITLEWLKLFQAGW